MPDLFDHESSPWANTAPALPSITRVVMNGWVAAVL